MHAVDETLQQERKAPKGAEKACVRSSSSSLIIAPNPTDVYVMNSYIFGLVCMKYQIHSKKCKGHL